MAETLLTPTEAASLRMCMWKARVTQQAIANQMGMSRALLNERLNCKRTADASFVPRFRTAVAELSAASREERAVAT